MSRNLCETSCHICYRDIVLCGEPHPITKDEAGVYLDEFNGMVVADAVCTFCDAKYLAWVNDSTRRRRRWGPPRGPEGGKPFFDLSFREAFNDEPAAVDLPTPEMLLRVHLEQCGAEALRAVEKIRELVLEATTALETSLARGSHWESYRREKVRPPR